jgi:uncharacterized membrane protein YqgA involved in biofilm formation
LLLLLLLLMLLSRRMTGSGLLTTTGLPALILGRRAAHVAPNLPLSILTAVLANVVGVLFNPECGVESTRNKRQPVFAVAFGVQCYSN